MFEEKGGCGLDVPKGQARSLRDVQKRVTAVRHAEHPEHRKLQARDARSTDCAKQAALAELRLAVRFEVDVRHVLLLDIDDLPKYGVGLSEPLCIDEVRVVQRRMIFRELAVAPAHQRADGESKAWRIVLALVVSV